MLRRVLCRQLQPRQIRYYSSTTSGKAPELDISRSREHCLGLLAKQDRSSYILHTYLPPSCRDGFIAARCFNLETAKVSDSVSKPELATMRFDFWKSMLQKCLSPQLQDLKSIPKEPVATLLAYAHLQGTPITKKFLLTLLQSRETFQESANIRDINAMGSYGEGVYSQLNYLTQEMLYSVSPTFVNHLNECDDSVGERLHNLMAHIGQATGVTTFLRGIEFFTTRKHFVPLPVDVMAKHGVSQQSVVDHYAKQTPMDPKLADVVFETATRANDHILTAQSLMRDLTGDLGKLPDAVVVPALSAVPVQLYLERLERCNFDITNPKMKRSEWKLPYRSFKAYKLRKL